MSARGRIRSTGEIDFSKLLSDLEVTNTIHWLVFMSGVVYDENTVLEEEVDSILGSIERQLK